MRIGEHRLREHVRLLLPLFGLITAVWALRLVMAFAGAPHELIRLMSVSVAAPVAVLASAFLIHFKRFGSYASVVAGAFLLVCYSQLLIVASIAFAVLTGTMNVYVAAEYGGKFSYTRHIFGHLTYGVGLESIFAAIMGCVLLLMLRVFVPTKAMGGGTAQLR